MEPEHLLQIATDLAEINTRRPRRADLCRAVSTAYYALFHCLARTCADRLAGGAGTVGERPTWQRVYRALDHKQARTRCENVPASFPDGARQFGQVFSALQKKRHVADYDPEYRVVKSAVIADINNVRVAIDRFLDLPRNVRRDFAIHVLMKVRTQA